MIETCRLKNVVIFLQTILSFVLQEKKYQATFVFICYKTIKIRVNSTKRRFMMDHCSNLLLFCETSISKNGNDPLTSFLLVNFILAYFVFNYSLKFSTW